MESESKTQSGEGEKKKGCLCVASIVRALIARGVRTRRALEITVEIDAQPAPASFYRVDILMGMLHRGILLKASCRPPSDTGSCDEYIRRSLWPLSKAFRGN